MGVWEAHFRRQIEDYKSFKAIKSKKNVIAKTLRELPRLVVVQEASEENKK
jgi:hypothetical protein